MDFTRVKKFFSYYKPYRGLFAADVLCSLGASALSLIFPLLVRQITGDIILRTDASAIAPAVLRVGAGLLLVILAKGACILFYDYKGHAMGALMEGDLRRELFLHMQRLPVSFFDKEKTGALMSRMTNDLLNLAELYHHGPEDLLNYTLTFIGAIVIMFSISARLTWTSLAILAATVLYAIWQSRLLHASYKNSRERISELNVRLEDSLAGIREAKAYCAEEVEARSFGESNDAFTQSRVGIYKREAYYYAIVSDFLSPLLTVVAVTLGALRIADGTMTAADLIAYVLYIGYFSHPMVSISRLAQMTQNGLTGFNRFMEIIETPTEPSSGAAAPDPVRGDIEFSGVRFRYNDGQRDVLADVSLNLRAGETTAIVGASGAGKTTLSALIPRFYEPVGGSVLLDGADIGSINPASLRTHVGYVRQDAILFGGTVASNILYGKPGASRDEVIAAARKAAAHDFIIKLPNGYDTDVGQRGVKLSGGQRQRISLARVFLKDPPVLILDEATSALDSETERAVREELNRFASSRTTLIIAHRLETIRTADRILVLTESGIAEEGTHETLLAANGPYSRLYRANN